MPEIFYIFQVRVEKTHQLYNGVCIALSFFFILKRHQVLDHLLDMTPILTHDQVVSRRVVFHVYMLFYPKLQEKSHIPQCWYPGNMAFLPAGREGELGNQ